MAPALTAVYAKVRSWATSIASPSSTHASGMLIILGILAAVTDAQSAKEEPIRVHHPKVASSRHPPAPGSGASAAASSSSSEKLGANHDGGADAQQINSQEMMYYLAMGMSVSQGLIRLITFISNRREAAALAARKKNDDLLQENSDNDDSHNSSAKKIKRKGLSLNALEDLDEETLKQKRMEHLATLGDNASLLGSDSEDDDYEQSDEESSSEEELEEEEEESEEEEEEAVEDSESEGEMERRRRVLAAGDAVIEE
ncbi:unnamed protein product [Mortierella alpina]